MLYYAIYVILVRYGEINKYCPCADISYIYIQYRRHCKPHRDSQVNEMMGLSFWSASDFPMGKSHHDWGLGRFFAGPLKQIQVVGCHVRSKHAKREQSSFPEKQQIWFEHVWVKHRAWCLMGCCKRCRSMSGRLLSNFLGEFTWCLQSHTNQPASIRKSCWDTRGDQAGFQTSEDGQRSCASTWEIKRWRNGRAEAETTWRATWHKIWCFP